MKIKKELSHEYVCCLPKEIEAEVMKEIEETISTLLLTDEEKAEAIENANNSKVCDLTDTIEIEFI